MVITGNVWLKANPDGEQVSTGTGTKEPPFPQPCENDLTPENGDSPYNYIIRKILSPINNGDSVKFGFVREGLPPKNGDRIDILGKMLKSLNWRRFFEFTYSQRAFYLKEVMDRAGTSVGSITRYMDELQRLGIIELCDRLLPLSHDGNEWEIYRYKFATPQDVEKATKRLRADEKRIKSEAKRIIKESRYPEVLKISEEVKRKPPGASGYTLPMDIAPVLERFNIPPLKHLEYAEDVAELLRKEGVRVWL
jgi:hypothetical protein